MSSVMIVKGLYETPLESSVSVLRRRPGRDIFNTLEIRFLPLKKKKELTCSFHYLFLGWAVFEQVSNQKGEFIMNESTGRKKNQ